MPFVKSMSFPKYDGQYVVEGPEMLKSEVGAQGPSMERGGCP